jgi:acyl carrier protein phosphodiesterase
MRGVNLVLISYFIKGNDELLLGSLLSNFQYRNSVTKDFEDFQYGIQSGLLALNCLCDCVHFKESERRLSTKNRKKSTMLIKLFYEHFLIKYWSDYSDTPIQEVEKKISSLLKANVDLFPTTSKNVTYLLSEHNGAITNLSTISGLNDYMATFNKWNDGQFYNQGSIIDLTENYELFYEDFKKAMQITEYILDLSEEVLIAK